jgi:hypothetical protein
VKTFFISLALVLMSLQAFAQGSAQLMAEAQRAYIRGDVQTAKQKFQLILAGDPTNQSAMNYMRMIEALERKQGTGAELARQLDSLIMPKIEFRDATFGSALDYMKQQAEKVSGGKTKVNFVVSLPQEFVDMKRVTLNLTNVPFSEALRYLGDLVEVKFSVEKYAVLVRPRAAESLPLPTPQ